MSAIAIGEQAIPPTYRSPAEVVGVRATVDFLWLWLLTDDDAYADLYRGICVSEIAAASDESAILWEQRTEQVLRAITSGRSLSTAQSRRLTEFLERTHAALPMNRQRVPVVPVLFMGDCLLEEVALFAAARAIDDGILLRAEHVVSRNPLDQQRQLRSRNLSDIRAVFYSPFSYGFTRDFARVLKMSHSLCGTAELEEIVSHASQVVRRSIEVLADAVECPIFVSNAATLQRGTTRWRRLVKSALTSRTRRRAREQMNSWLRGHLKECNERTYPQLFLVDEAALVPDEIRQGELGAYLHTLNSLHPTRFSQRLAEPIVECVRAATLTGRKLIACNPGESLWRPEEGAGTTSAPRLPQQDVLSRLKEKGIVLALVPSEPVTAADWQGSLLDPGFFVATEEVRDSTLAAVQRVCESLNIKPKDAVLLDSATHAEIAGSQHRPKVEVADPSTDRTWRILSRWADLLDEQQEFDRTAMYRERHERESLVRSSEVAQEAAAMFSRLGLRATLTPGAPGAIRRITELINRTNQWNLTASRASAREVQHWMTSTGWRILTVQVEDRFGAMGTICVVVLRERGNCYEIPVFVLSCRVFGYGVESLVLDHVKRLAEGRFGAPAVRGLYHATEYNSPCRDMYLEHGYTFDGEAWTYVGTPGEKTPADWFALSGFDV